MRLFGCVVAGWMDGWMDLYSVLLFRCVILPQPGAELLMLPTKITVLRSIDGWRGSEIGSSSVEWNKYRMCVENRTSPHLTAPHPTNVSPVYKQKRSYIAHIRIMRSSPCTSSRRWNSTALNIVGTVGR